MQINTTSLELIRDITQWGCDKHSVTRAETLVSNRANCNKRLMVVEIVCL